MGGGLSKVGQNVKATINDLNAARKKRPPLEHVSLKFTRGATLSKRELDSVVRLPVTAEWDAVVRVLQNTFGREVYFSWADEEEIVVVDTVEEWEDSIAELTEDWGEGGFSEYNGTIHVALVEAEDADKTVTGHRRAEAQDGDGAETATRTTGTFLTRNGIEVLRATKDCTAPITERPPSLVVPSPKKAKDEEVARMEEELEKKMVEMRAFELESSRKQAQLAEALQTKTEEVPEHAQGETSAAHNIYPDLTESHDTASFEKDQQVADNAYIAHQGPLPRRLPPIEGGVVNCAASE